MQLIPAKLPNEILIPILCDVLSTYIHAFITLPPGYPRWHGHCTLRRVSRRFKSLVDYIWGSSVGNGESELQKMRMAMLKRDLKIPGDEVSPLVKAYSLYIQLFDDELCSETGPYADYVEMWKTSSEFYAHLRVMNAFITKVVPRAMSKILSEAADRNKSRRETESMFHAVDFLSGITVHRTVLTKEEEPDSGRRLTLLEGYLGRFVRKNERFRMRVDFRIIIKLEEVLHHYCLQWQNEEINVESQQSVDFIASFIVQWFYDNGIDWFRKRALDRAAVYGLKSRGSSSVL